MNMLRLLSGSEVRTAVNMHEAIEVMRDVFCQLSSHKVDVPLRTSITSPSGTTLVMPAYLPASAALGLKVASIYPGNVSRGLPTVTALVAALDPETGQPIAVMEGAYLTSLRTGAASGVATDVLARKDAHTLSVIGAGAQARTQIEAVCCVRDIQEIHVFGRTRTSAEALAAELSRNYPTLNVTAATTRSEVVKGADIVITATNSSTPVFNGEDLTPGVHINAIGSFRPDMQEIDEYTVERAVLVVDQREAVLSEAGDIIIPIRKGVITEEHIYAELGEIILGLKPGRRNNDEMTLFKSVGNAAQDVAIARLVLQSAEENNIGTVIPL